MLGCIRPAVDYVAIYCSTVPWYKNPPRVLSVNRDEAIVT